MTSNSSSPEGQRVQVAAIRRPHGVRGELLIDITTDHPERFQVGSRLTLSRAGDRGRCVEVEGMRPGPGTGAILKLREIGDREEAARWNGGSLEIEAGEIRPAPEGHYYPQDLVGLVCRDERLGDLGRIEALVEAGGGVLLRVVRGEGQGSRQRRELLIPFVEAYAPRVDRGSGSLWVRLPEGFVATCASRS
jgi:16S rRNA processing protein RimM